MVMGGLAEEMLVDFLAGEPHFLECWPLAITEAASNQPKVQAFLARVREEATTIDLDAMRQEAARLIMEVQR